MISRKYSGDYRLVDNVTERGGIRTEAEYVGGDYFFCSGRETAARLGARLTALSLALCACYVAALLPRSGASRVMYAVLPFAFSALPLGFLTGSSLALLRAREPLRRETADKISHRLPACALWALILSAAGRLGEGAAALSGDGRMLWGDIVFSVCAAAIAGGSGLVFSRRSLLRTEERKK